MPVAFNLLDCRNPITNDRIFSEIYFDEVYDQVLEKQLRPADLLLGRKTFDIFAGCWPTHAKAWPGINEVNKYVLSNTLDRSDWQNSIFLTRLEEIRKLKKLEGAGLQVHGSGELVQLLLNNDLIDELWLKIHSGKNRRKTGTPGGKNQFAGIGRVSTGEQKRMSPPNIFSQTIYK